MRVRVHTRNSGTSVRRTAVLFSNDTTRPAEQYNFGQDNRGYIEGSSEVGRGSFNQFSVLRTQVQDFKPEYADYLYFI